MLQVGIVLTVLKAAFYVALLLFLGPLLAIFGAIGVSEAHGDEAIGIVALVGLGEVVLLFMGLFQIAVLVVCAMAWRSGKPVWLWSLVALSALSFLQGDCFSVVIGVIAIVGAVQALDRRDT
jgi:hypothetical protein